MQATRMTNAYEIILHQAKSNLTGQGLPLAAVTNFYVPHCALIHTEEKHALP
jgi:hypothetical protein